MDETDSGLLPYRETTDPQYSGAAAFSVEKAGFDGWILRGLCPRCEAQISVPVIDPVFGGSRTRFAPGGVDGDLPDSDDDSVPVLCTCTDMHPGRPEGAVGCGAYWDYVLPF